LWYKRINLTLLIKKKEEKNMATNEHLTPEDVFVAAIQGQVNKHFGEEVDYTDGRDLATFFAHSPHLIEPVIQGAMKVGNPTKVAD
jgi:hypothetical protein